MSRFKSVAVIPARGGSKRFPGKNRIEFFGHPIISYTIQAALDSGLFERVAVSSDDPAILEIAAAYGAVPVQRRPEMATDEVATAPMLLDFLDQEKAAGRDDWEVLCCLYATAALRTADDIKETVGLIEPGVCEFSMGVSQADRQAHQALQVTPDGRLEPMFPDIVSRQSQEIGPLWFSNGTSYALWVPSFRIHQTLYGPTLKGHYMPAERAVDLDEPEDMELMKFYFSQRQGQAEKQQDLLNVWRGNFGNNYIARNSATPQKIQDRQHMWQRILSCVPELNSILEVGSNIGLNLRALKSLTTATLTAVEPSAEARKILVADGVLPAGQIHDGSATTLPLADEAVDLAFTCGVLIHVPPSDLDDAMVEIHRVAKRFILCCEYFAPEAEELPYQGEEGLLFRNDYGRCWMEQFPSLRLVDYGFFWKPATGIGNMTWWMFEK
ncbi:methyltransferase domain-containing protein [Thalassospiraceae bacterium LMO-JJ14]|nr:methyltransferase domain-containing protein [Thalassospiraceae bacterium LMO-JJ14]